MMMLVARQIFLGMSGILIVAFFAAKISIAKHWEWAVGVSVKDLMILYGSWMVAGSFTFFIVYWGGGLIGAGIILMCLLILTIFVDEKLYIGFFSSNNLTVFYAFVIVGLFLAMGPISFLFLNALF